MSNKFGMFIHWGVYALYEKHEQVLARWDIDKDEYEKRAMEFNPTEYDPEEWVLLAKSAGMKYICFTAKHHDGFCMWDTKYTSYNIMNTPYGKDVLKMLSDACRKHDMLLSIYYSNPDWYHPNAYNPLSSHQWKAYTENPDLEVYREFVKNQITELLTNYGKIYTFFWDIPPMYEDKSINELVRSLQPDILINDRGYDKGDFSTPERTVPEGSRFERMTEACESVSSHSWGYSSRNDYYSVRYLMSSIDKIMAMGGSYLLNVGPMASGKIDARSRSIIERIGKWYTSLGGALEDAQPDGEYKLINSDKYIALRKDGKSYFHFYEGLRVNSVDFESLPCAPKRAVLLNSGDELEVIYEKASVGFSFVDGKIVNEPIYRIIDIPVDDYIAEPIVIEIEW